MSDQDQTKSEKNSFLDKNAKTITACSATAAATAIVTLSLNLRASKQFAYAKGFEYGQTRALLSEVHDAFQECVKFIKDEGLAEKFTEVTGNPLT